MAQMIDASAAPISANDSSVEEIRRSIKYHPSLWGDHFLAYTSNVTEITAAEKEQLETLKVKVQKLLAETPDDSTVKMELIDAIQRLGVAYHFQKEIDESLLQIHDTYEMECNKDKIGVVALRFRMLRQQGYRVTCDVFNKFMDEEGNLKESLRNDVEGMLSLYEASNYGFNGEEVLDKALQFSSSHLESLLPQMRTSLCMRVKKALEMPIHKTLIRLGAPKFMPVYEEDDSHSHELLHFAKLDFHIVQKFHQNELHHITRWWKELDFGSKLPFARDRVVESYFWASAVFFEPQFSNGRMFVAKNIAMIAIIDDIYDVYGTLDELRVFTDAIISWEMSKGNDLPSYMRITYEALLGVFSEMEDELKKQGKSSYEVELEYAKQETIKLYKSYMVEAEWCYSKYVPTMDEYMELGLVSGTYMMLSTCSLVGMGDDIAITKHDFDWITSEPTIVRASSVLGRLMDDIAGKGMEQKITAVDCYMKEKGCSEKEAITELSKLVKKAWKDLYEECVEPRAAAMVILERVVNLSRILCVAYVGKDDGYSNSTTRFKDSIQLLFIDPIH